MTAVLCKHYIYFLFQLQPVGKYYGELFLIGQDLPFKILGYVEKPKDFIFASNKLILLPRSHLPRLFNLWWG